MTKFLQRLFTGVALAGLVFVTPVLAQECEYGTQVELNTQVARAAETGAVVKTLTDTEVAEVLEKVGRPPNAADSPGIGITRVDHEGWAALFFTQNGCFIDRIGPVPVDMLNLKLGITSAGEKID